MKKYSCPCEDTITKDTLCPTCDMWAEEVCIMNKQVELEIHANMDKWRKEMAEIIEIAFLNSNNIDEFVREADEKIRKKFSMPYSLSLETLYYSLRTIWELKGEI